MAERGVVLKTARNPLRGEICNYLDVTHTLLKPKDLPGYYFDPAFYNNPSPLLAFLGLNSGRYQSTLDLINQTNPDFNGDNLPDQFSIKKEKEGWSIWVIPSVRTFVNAGRARLLFDGDYNESRKEWDEPTQLGLIPETGIKEGTFVRNTRILSVQWRPNTNNLPGYHGSLVIMTEGYQLLTGEPLEDGTAPATAPAWNHSTWVFSGLDCKL